jgi:ABC-2 type transport system permease protein
MSAPSQSLAGEVRGAAPATTAALPVWRVLGWLVRRELWENRGTYRAPLAIAGVILLGFAISLRHLGEKVGAALAAPTGQQAHLLFAPYGVATAVILFTGVATSMFYCIDCLHAERRDRSILFWKSLPVSDLLTVLAKAAIPMAVMPTIACLAAFATQLLMVAIGSLALLATDLDATTLLKQVPLFQQAPVAIYGMLTLTLWYAPLYAWMVLVSGWARRTLIWTVLPPAALALLEKIALGSGHFAALLKYRFIGSFQEAFSASAQRGGMIDPLTQLEPVHFLASAGLWSGLIVAALLLAGAVWQRRRAQPL